MAETRATKIASFVKLMERGKTIVIVIQLWPVRRQGLWPRFEVVTLGGFWCRRSDEGAKMRPKPLSAKKPAEQVVKDIRRATRRHFSAEDKIRLCWMAFAARTA
jgi:hypothetical protein